jgi:hypothetical protein
VIRGSVAVNGHRRVVVGLGPDDLQRLAVRGAPIHLDLRDLGLLTRVVLLFDERPQGLRAKVERALEQAEPDVADVET